MATSLFCLAFLLPQAFRQADAFEPFFNDIVELLNTTSISIIINSNFDQEYDASVINFQNPTSFMSYTSEGEVSKIIQHLLLQRFMGDLDLILFLGGDHSKLLRRLVNEEQFFNSGVAGLLPEDNHKFKDLSLKLNTNLFFYTWENDRIILKEKYAIRGIPVENNVGSWTERTGFEVKERRMWERRTNLLGSSVRAVSVNLPPLHELYQKDTDEVEITSGGGFFIEPLNYLAKKLNFTVHYSVSIDDKFGSVDANGTWNGMIGMLVANMSDVAAACLTRTKKRDGVTSFSITLMEEEVTLAAPISTKPATNLWVYVDTFPKITWAICGAMVVAIALGFAAIDALINHVHDHGDLEELNIFNAIGLSAFDSAMQLPYNICIKHHSSKIMFFFAGIGIYVIFAHYSASLTAQMTSGPRRTPIKSFADVIKEEYQVIVEDSTSMHIFLETARPGSAMHRFYYNNMENNPDSFVSSVDEGLNVLYSNYKTLTFTSSLDGLLPSGSRLEFLDIQGHQYRQLSNPFSY